MKCPNCQSEIPNEATVCPNCSHELTPVVGEAATEGANKASRPGWLIFGGVAAAVLVVGVAAFALSGRSPVAASFADRVPADAFAYIEVDIEALMSNEVKDVVAAFGPIVEMSTGEDFDVDAWFDEIIDSFDAELAESDMSYEQDIATWASGPVAIGMLGAADDPDVAVVVGGSDAAALDSFLSKIEAEADGTEEIGGVRFLTTTDGDQQMYVGRVDNDLVAVSDAALAQTMVSGPEQTLAQDDDFNARLDALGDGAIITFAVDSEKATELSGATAPLSPMMMTQDFGAYTTGWLAGSLGVTDGNIRMEYSVTMTEDFPQRNADPAVEAALPAETIAFFRVGPLIDQLALLGEGGALQGMEEAYGVTLDELVGLFAVDGALAVWPSTDPEIPVNGAIVALSDSNQDAVVGDIAELGRTLGWGIADTDWGYTFEGSVGLGTRDQLTLLTTQSSLIEGAPDGSFADSELKRRAGSLVDGDLALALDVPAIIDLVDGFVAADDPETADALACLPIGVIAAGTNTSGTTVHATSVIEITDPC